MYRSEVEVLKQAMADWLMFQAKVPAYLNYEASVVKGENIPVRSDGYFEEAENYYRMKMSLS